MLYQLFSTAYQQVLLNKSESIDVGLSVPKSDLDGKQTDLCPTKLSNSKTPSKLQLLKV